MRKIWQLKYRQRSLGYNTKFLLLHSSWHLNRAIQSHSRTDNYWGQEIIVGVSFWWLLLCWCSPPAAPILGHLSGKSWELRQAPHPSSLLLLLEPCISGRVLSLSWFLVDFEAMFCEYVRWSYQVRGIPLPPSPCSCYMFFSTTWNSLLKYKEYWNPATKKKTPQLTSWILNRGQESHSVGRLSSHLVPYADPAGKSHK